MGETFAKTPVMAQWETKEPPPDSFLYARSMVDDASELQHPPAELLLQRCGMYDVFCACRRLQRPQPSMQHGTRADRQRHTAPPHTMTTCGPGAATK
jgi:hypothetical protein